MRFTNETYTVAEDGSLSVCVELETGGPATARMIEVILETTDVTATCKCMKVIVIGMHRKQGGRLAPLPPKFQLQVGGGGAGGFIAVLQYCRCCSSFVSTNRRRKSHYCCLE